MSLCLSVFISVCLSQTMVAVWVKTMQWQFYVCSALSLLFVKAYTYISCKKTAGTSRVWVTVHCPCEVIRLAKASG